MTGDWPHPDAELTLAGAAEALGLTRSGLSKNVLSVKKTGAALSKRPEVAAVAALYAGLPLGTAAKPPARQVMLAAGVEPAEFEGTPMPAPRQRRLRIGKKEIGLWRSMPPARLAAEMREAWGRMESRETKNAKRRVLEIAEVLRNRSVPMPERWITPESVVVFASMADWAARAGAGMAWPFLLCGESRRPIDLMSARPAQMREGELSLLTPLAYAKALLAALESEARALEEAARAAAALAEGAALDAGTGPPLAPSRNYDLSSKPPTEG